MDCLACGLTSSPESHEHVFPRWLLKAFGSLRLEVGLNRLLDNRQTAMVREHFALDAFKLKKICEDCNNGWMREIQDSCKPLIMGIINGDVALGSLSKDQRCTLARWAGKTAIIESYAVSAECPVDRAFLREIKLDVHGYPGRFAVAACTTDFLGFGHVQAGAIADLLGGGKAAGNIILIGLPKLVFLWLPYG